MFRRSTAALFLAFLPLAFSEDLLGFLGEQGSRSVSSALVVLDVVLYGLIALVLGPVAHFGRPSRSRRLLVESLVCTVILDLARLFGAFNLSLPWGELGAAVLYLIPQTLIYLAIAVAREQPWLAPQGIWAVGGPLLLGTAITWVLGVVVWPSLESASKGLVLNQAYYAPPRVSQEYFAQVTQLLPILLVAVAVELRFFRHVSPAPSGAQQARTAVVAGIVAAGVFASVLSLLRPDDRTVMLNDLGLWAEYFAYVLTINAVSVAVVALVWALVAERAPNRSDMAVLSND